MKREPNPYSKNPRLTVTSTMSISVPSMVAEDVLDGTDAPVITVDPNVNDRIDTISGAVELMDTRIDAVSDMTELLYVNCVSADEALSERIDTVSEAISLSNADAILTINKLSDNGLGYAATQYSNDHDGLTNINSGQVYEVITIKDDKSNAVYPIAALGLVCPATNNTGIYWQKSGQTYDLQFTRNGGKSWTSLTGSTSSTSGSYLPVYGSTDSSVCLYTTSTTATAYKDTDLIYSRVFKFGPSSTNITYGLQTALAAIGIQGAPGKQLQAAGDVQMALVQGGTASSVPHFVWWNNEGSEYKKWEPWKEAGSSSSGSLASVTTKSDKLYRLEFSQENSFMYALSQQYSSSELAYCNGIACNYFREPTGDARGYQAEMRFKRNTSTQALEIQLREDQVRDWVTVASTADTSSSGSSNSGLEVDSYLAELAPTLEFYDGSNYVNFTNVVEGKAGIGLVLKSSPGKCSDAVYPIYTPGLINPQNKDYRLAWLAHNSGEFELKQTTDGGSTWTSLAGGSSSGSTSNKVIFGPFDPSRQYELSLELSGGRTDQYSAVVELKSDNYPGDAALGAYLAAPSDGSYSPSVLMAVSDMGTLVFKSHDKVVKYDLSNLGGSSESGGDISFSTRGGTDYSLGFEVDKGADDHSAIVSLTSTGSNEFSGIAALGTWLNCPSYRIGDTNVSMAVSGVGTLVFNRYGSITTYDLNNLGGSGSGSTSGNYLPVSGAIDSLCLYPTHDNATTYLSTIRHASRVLRFGPSSTDVVYGLQTALAAIGTQGKPGSQVIDAGAVQMALVQGSSASSEPHFVWWNNAMSQYSKWEPWKEAGSSSSSDSSFYWSDTKMPTSSIVATLSYPGYSDKYAVLINNPLYAGQYNSRPCAVRPYISDNGTLTWERRIESGSWTQLGASGTAFSLGLYDGSIGNDSGSVMLPLITTPASNGVFRFDDQISLCRWETGWSADDALTNRSGIKTLMANPIALFDSAYKDLDSNYVSGAVRLVNMHGKITWQKANYSTGYWEAMEDASTSSSATMCLYTKKLANADSGTSVSSISASVSYGFNGTSSTDLGYLIINRQGVDHQISLHDLNWLLSNKAKLAELLK